MPLLDRPRSTTEILDAAFAVTRAHYAPLLGIALAAHAPLVLAYLWLTATVGTFWLQAAGALIGAIQGAAVMAYVADLVYGRTPSARAALARMARRLPALLLLTLFAGLLIMVGLVLLVIPGLLLWANLFAMPAALVVEELPAGEALARSARLVDGRTWPVLGALLVTAILTAALGAAVGWLTGSAVQLATSDAGAILASTSLASVLFAPFASVVSALLYFDLRIRKEAFDLELMARELPPARTAVGAG